MPQNLPFQPYDLLARGTHVVGMAVDSMHEDANSDRPGIAPRGPSHKRWRRDALQPLEMLWD